MFKNVILILLTFINVGKQCIIINLYYIMIQLTVSMLGKIINGYVGNKYYVLKNMNFF